MEEAYEYEYQDAKPARVGVRWTQYEDESWEDGAAGGISEGSSSFAFEYEGDSLMRIVEDEGEWTADVTYREVAQKHEFARAISALKNYLDATGL